MEAFPKTLSGGSRGASFEARISVLSAGSGRCRLDLSLSGDRALAGRAGSDQSMTKAEIAIEVLKSILIVGFCLFLIGLANWGLRA